MNNLPGYHHLISALVIPAVNLVVWTLRAAFRLSYRFPAAFLRAPTGRRSRWAVRIILVLFTIPLMLFPVGDGLRLSIAEAASRGHRFDIVSWEIDNFLDKWVHRVWTAFPWTDTGEGRRRADVARYE